MAPGTGPYSVYTPDKQALLDDEIDVPPSSRRSHFSHSPNAGIESRGHHFQALTSPRTPTTPGTPQELSLRGNSSSEMGHQSHRSVDILNLATLFCGKHSIEYLINTLSSVAEITQETLGWEAGQREPELLQVPRLIDPVPDVEVINSGSPDLHHSSTFALPNFLLDSNSVEGLEVMPGNVSSRSNTIPRLDIGGSHEGKSTILTRTQAQEYTLERLHQDFDTNGFRLPPYDRYKANERMSTSSADENMTIEPFEGEDEEVLVQPDYSHFTNSE